MGVQNTDSSTIIELNHISVTFREGGRTVEAVKDVTMHVREGEIFGIVGFSGAGKSTLVRTINLLERPTEGQVIIDGHDVTDLKGGALRELRKKIGFIFQGFNLIDNVTVGRNVEFALKAGGWPKKGRRARVEELLDIVGLAEKADSYPSSLSGGQKQRVSIARALANSPRILLCDEATSALDLETTEEILTLLKRINTELGITIVFITHQFDVAKAIFDDVAVMEQGVIVEQGTTFDVFSSPHHPTTQALVERYLGIAIPEQLVPQLPPGRLIELRYRDGGAFRPLISEVAQHHDVSINVLHGNVGYFGAQAVGTDGVDRRIDVIATAMRAGLKAKDLIDLDLAYAPPYGQAKDPVNQTGMVAHNVLTGELVLTGPDALTEDMPVLDVRTVGEYAAGHMPNSLNIPHTQLRDRLDEVRSWVDEKVGDQPFVVMCAAGVRSWIGYRIVRHAGFNVTMLSGGIQTLRAWLGDRAEAVLVTGEGRS